MTEQRFRLDGWLVDVPACRLSRGKESRHLEPKVMNTLANLAARQGDVYPKDELIAAVWGHCHVSDAALTRCIFEIRQAFGDDAKKPRVVETIPRVGYRLMLEPVTAARPRSHRAARARWLAAASIAALSVALWGVQDAYIAATPAIDGKPGTGIPAAKVAYRRGYAHYVQEDYLANANAITFFEQAIDHDPSFGLAYTRLADALTQLALRWNKNRLGEAREAATRALALDPNDADAYSALGLAQLLDNDTDAALLTLRRGYELDPTHWKSMYNAAMAHKARFEYEEAISLFHRVLELAPSHHKASGQLGYLYLRRGETGAARHWLENSLEYAPESVMVRRELAIMALIERDPPAAIDNCRRVLDQLSAHLPCLQLTAAAYLQLGDTAGARQHYEAANENHEGTDYARLGIALALIADGDQRPAVDMVNAVLEEALLRIKGEHKPRNDYRLIAACYSMLGDHSAALAWLAKASEAGPLFALWNATDPVFAGLHADARGRPYLTSTVSDISL